MSFLLTQARRFYALFSFLTSTLKTESKRINGRILAEEPINKRGCNKFFTMESDVKASDIRRSKEGLLRPGNNKTASVQTYEAVFV